MMTIRGSIRHGLIIDPGAGRALIGIDTLRHYRDEVLQPHGVSVSTRASKSTVTGVDGRTDPSIGVCDMKLYLKGYGALDIYWNPDMMGESGLQCSSPLWKDPLVSYRATIMENALPHKNGILALLPVANLTVPKAAELLLFRPLFIDSGHYFLQIDEVNLTESELRHELDILRRAAAVRFKRLTNTKTWPKRYGIVELQQQQQTQAGSGVEVSNAATASPLVDVKRGDALSSLVDEKRDGTG